MDLALNSEKLFIQAISIKWPYRLNYHKSVFGKYSNQEGNNIDILDSEVNNTIFIPSNILGFKKNNRNRYTNEL